MTHHDDKARASDDETQLTPSSSSGWLTSSGSIDHGRFAPGTLLGGRYRIVGRLGRGGMGEVYRADDLKLGQPVALKFLPPDVDRDPARLTQLHTEVRMARQVSHPNVCRVYDIDEVEGNTFLSMEYVDGEDLGSLLRRIGRFPEERGLQIARQICAGLQAAHERGVVHRDFKPANVMLDGAGNVRITDFGLAGVAGEALRAGTPAYMAPEQLAGAEVTARSDIYALGLVLYEIFTGQRALDAKNLAELIRRREQAEIVPPAALVRDLSPEIDRAVMRCLAADPQDRPRSALAVSAALPGGDPLAQALAAGETPSPEMVAAAGETGALSRAAGLALVAFIVGGLITSAVLADGALLVGRAPLDMSGAVLAARAREILALTGNAGPVADTASGVSPNYQYLTYVARTDRSRTRWNALAAGNAPALLFWYRTSPRTLVPLEPNWSPASNDPPLSFTGMATVVLDNRGRLLQFVTMPPQRDESPTAAGSVDWGPLFSAAGLKIDDFTASEPQWTPRIYAERRSAWEGPMPSMQGVRLRVEAAEYRGRPVAFQVVAPWTEPDRMPATTARSPALRALSAAGTTLMVVLLAGAALLVRYHWKSGRADRRGAARIALFLLSIWLAAWILGARHWFEINVELDHFITFLAFALTNVMTTWALYLALEPLVRRLFPDILISWTRLLAGQFRNPRVGRDILIGIAFGVYFALVRSAFWNFSFLSSGATAQLQTSNVQFLLEDRYTVATLLRLVPIALQNALLGTFLFVILRAIVGRAWIAIAIGGALLVTIIVFESGGLPLYSMLILVALAAVPLVVVFLRYGLLPVTAGMLVNLVLGQLPMTADFAKPHAAVSTFTLLTICAIAVAAFYVAGAGRGMFKSLLPD